MSTQPLTTITPKSGLSIADYLSHHIPWSAQTFGPGTRYQGVIAHIERELGEVDRVSGDAVEACAELIDVAILALDGAWRIMSDGHPDHPGMPAAIEDEILDALLWTETEYARMPDTDRLRRMLDRIDTTHPVDMAMSAFCEIAAEAMMQIWLLSVGDWATTVRTGLYAKLSRNMARQWPDWRTRSADEPIEHIRTADEAEPNGEVAA